MQWLKLPAWKSGYRALWYLSFKERFSIVGSLREGEIASSTSDRQGSGFESFV